MSIQTLLDRFTKGPRNHWDLSSELSDLLGEELEENLTDEGKSTLSDFRSAFQWDTKYRIYCKYIIPTSSLSGSYEVDDLKEYLSIEEGQDTSLSTTISTALMRISMEVRFRLKVMRLLSITSVSNLRLLTSWV